MTQKNNNHSPSIFGSVTISTDFTHNSVTHFCRGLWADADGTITVTMEDGTAGVSKQVFRGVNYFRCAQVTNLGGLSLGWFA